MDLTELAREIHADNVAAGWWPDEDKSKRYDTCLMLIVSELAEAMEGDRKNLMDDHLSDLPMFQVELADAAIRLLDLAGSIGAELTYTQLGVRASTKMLDGADCVPEQLLAIVSVITVPSGLAPAYGYVERVQAGVGSIVALTDIHGIDLLAVIERKREYNRTRADHSKAARAGANGKRY